MQCERPGFNPWVGKIPWRREWLPTPVFLLGDPMDRGAWRAIVHGVAKSQTQLSSYPPAPPHTHTRLNHLAIQKILHNIINKILHAKSLQSCLTLCDPMDCNPPGSSVHEIVQARILEWIVISSSGGSSQPRDQTLISCVSCVLYLDSLPLSYLGSLR